MFKTNGQKNFYMVIDDVFSITGRGTIAISCIKGGIMQEGDTAYLFNTKSGSVKNMIMSIEKFGENKRITELFTHSRTTSRNIKTR